MHYDLIVCPNRVSMNVFGDLCEKEPPNPFVQMLWDKGTKYEKEVIEGLEQPFLDLSCVADVEGNAEQPRPI